MGADASVRSDARAAERHPVPSGGQVKVYEDVRVVGGLFKAFPIVLRESQNRRPVPGRTAGARCAIVAGHAVERHEVRRIVKIESTSIDALDFEVISLEYPATSPRPPRHRLQRFRRHYFF